MEDLSEKLKLIEVSAFVGPAGTGKSHRATNVAREYNIDLIIDDGLVISRGRIMAGKSAKSEINMVRAIRRAIFEYDQHREEVINYLASRAPCKLMILATSEAMIDKIILKLGLNKPVKIINIADVASQDEINAALKERREKKQHVVPVARAQIQRNFAGKLVSQIRGLFKSRDKDDNKNTIVKPLFSFDGKVLIEPDAVLAMCRHLLATSDYVQNIHELEIEHELDDNMDVNVMLDFKLGNKSALEIAKLLQKRIKLGLSYFTGMNVKKVNINVKEVFLN